MWLLGWIGTLWCQDQQKSQLIEFQGCQEILQTPPNQKRHSPGTILLRNGWRKPEDEDEGSWWGWQQGQIGSKGSQFGL